MSAAAAIRYELVEHRLNCAALLFRNRGTIARSISAFMNTKHTTFTGSRYGQGWVGLATGTGTSTTQISAVASTEAVRSYKLQFGKRSSDDPDTTNAREVTSARTDRSQPARCCLSWCMPILPLLSSRPTH